MLYSQMLIYSFFNEYSGNITFSGDEMGILSVDLDNMNLDDANFFKDDPKAIIHVRRLAFHNKLK